jgi:DNA-directed RNA polymerase subunit omega
VKTHELRIEQIIAKALARLNNDRYILSIAVGQRADELSKGASSLIVDVDTTEMKHTDIALIELADGLLEVDGLVDKD